MDCFDLSPPFLIVLLSGYQRWMKVSRRTSKSENVQRLSNKTSNPALVRNPSIQSSKPNFFATGNLETHMSLRRDSMRNLAMTSLPLNTKLEQAETLEDAVGDTLEDGLVVLIANDEAVTNDLKAVFEQKYACLLPSAAHRESVQNDQTL